MHPDFEKNGYLVARNFFNKPTVDILSTYFDIKYRLIKYGIMDNARYSTVKNGDDANSYVFYGDHLTESISYNYGQSICNLLKLNLAPTYTYARIYEKTQPLLPHIDRQSCEISSTCPINISDDRPSTIYISNYIYNPGDKVKYTLDEVKAKGDYSQVDLYPGDALFYKGHERVHWRLPLESDSLTQFFMHFVQTNGQYADYALDRRPYIGFPASTVKPLA